MPERNDPVDPTAPLPVPPAQPASPVPPAPTTPSAQHGQPGAPAAKRPGLWRQATSTTGGTVAVIVAAGLTALLVLGLVGASVFLTARVVANHRQERVVQVGKGMGVLPPGLRKHLGLGAPNGQGAPGLQRKLGSQGIAPLLGGAMKLGGVQHGEFTTQDASGKATVMTLQRGTVTTASATSLTVKSADGFTATYAVDANTRGQTTGLTTGEAVVVVAQKAGAKAVLIRAKGQG
jgi:hypothetical protein